MITLRVKYQLFLLLQDERNEIMKLSIWVRQVGAKSICITALLHTMVTGSVYFKYVHSHTTRKLAAMAGQGFQNTLSIAGYYLSFVRFNSSAKGENSELDQRENLGPSSASNLSSLSA